MTEPVPGAITREIPIEFRASGSEYFRIWIVNLLLTIVTIGIYSAWAKVRRLRYFYGSTALEGSSFEYHGRPVAILKGRIVAVIAYGVIAILGQLNPLLSIAMLPLIIFGLPWIVMRSRMFQMRMSSWRGIRFNFHGSYGGALGAIIGWGILSVITLGILWPLALWKQVKYLLGNNSFGTQPFAFLTGKGRFYAFCAIGLGITILVALGVGLLLRFLPAAAPRFPSNDPVEVIKSFLTLRFFLTLLVSATGIMLVSAYFRSRMLNASIGGVEVGPHRLYSRLKAWPLFGILVTNMLGMIVTLGLFYPWAKVRAMRYQFEHTGVIAAGELNQFIADANQGISAVGEEVSDIFDIDFGF